MMDVPDSVTKLNWTSTFMWYVVRCGSKNKYQKDMCLKEIEQHVLNMMFTLKFNSQHN